MATATVPVPRDAAQVDRLLGIPEIRRLIASLDETRWTGRLRFWTSQNSPRSPLAATLKRRWSSGPPCRPIMLAPRARSP